jgi:superfamily II DNA/RNA helicase
MSSYGSYRKPSSFRATGGWHSHRSGSRPTQTRRPRGQYIDPARFIAVAKPVEATAYIPTHTFNDFKVDPLIQANLVRKGYVVPTPIQDQAIPPALDGKDIIGVANTGTGKTAAFAIPLLHKLLTVREARALIIAPTRELAQQIEAECRWMAAGSPIRTAVLIGGSSMGRQLQDLRFKPRLVIGTPGRIKDHIERGTLQLQHFNLAVLDEVDRMLDMGFVHDVTRILNTLSPNRQSFYFSATMDSSVTNLITGFTREPVTITHKTGDTSENIHQDIVRYRLPEERIEKLHDILLQADVEKIIIFDETKRSVERLSKVLLERGFQADSIHGGKTQGQRQRALKRFKSNEISILVATDVAARGIDVVDVTHVINYTTPQSYEDYVHRIGRAGRAGRIGQALTFVAG